MATYGDIAGLLRESQNWTLVQLEEKVTEWIQHEKSKGREGLPIKGDDSKLSRVERGILSQKDGLLDDAIPSIFEPKDWSYVLSHVRNKDEQEGKTPDIGMCDDNYSEWLRDALNKEGHEFEIWLFINDSLPFLSSVKVQEAWWHNIEERKFSYNLCWVPDASSVDIARNFGNIVVDRYLERGVDASLEGKINHYLLPSGVGPTSTHKREELRMNLQRQEDAFNGNHPVVKLTVVGDEEGSTSKSSGSADAYNRLRVQSLPHATPIGQTVLFKNSNAFQSFASFGITKAVAEPRARETHCVFYWLDSRTVEDLFLLTNELTELNTAAHLSTS